MKSKAVKNFLFIIFIILGVSLVYNLYSAYLDKQIDKLYKNKSEAVERANGSLEKDKGKALLSRDLNLGKTFFMGSSELSSPVPENPKNMFPNNIYKKNVTYTGAAYVQNYLQAMNLGSNSKSFNDNDFVIVESLQWFSGKDKNLDGTLSKFSELQFYEFLNNPNISEKNKVYLCKRWIETENYNGKDLYPIIDSLLEQHGYGKFIMSIINGYRRLLNKFIFVGNVTYPETYILARTYVSDSFMSKSIYQILRPFYYLRYKVMLLKDKYDTYNYLNTLEDYSHKETTINDWEEIQAIAQKEGEKACSNNDFYVYDEYYDKYLRERIDDLKDSSKDMQLNISKEWEDYMFFLDVCKDLNIKPYIVIMSTNGYYYDYIGLHKDRRAALYDKVESQALKYGFESLNLKDKEYIPYFYCDVMHLGWKGWAYVNEKIIENFTK